MSDLKSNNVNVTIPSVLIVDDEPEAGALFRDLIREQLDPRARVLEATDGRSALQLAEQYAIDVALIDYHLPDLDGLEVLAGLRHSKSNPATLLLTGSIDPQIVTRAAQLGAYETIGKSELHHVHLGKRMRGAIDARLRSQQANDLADQLRHDHEELDHLVRALSHDMNANFMLLQHAFRRLQRSTEPIATPEIQEDVAYLDACLTQSQRFLNDLISLGKTGQVDMTPSQVSLADVVRAVCYEQRDVLAERHIEVDIAEHLPELWCHADRLKQIVTNLIRNAARHGCSEANPRIAIRGGQTFGDTPQAWFRIEDNGRGISAQDRQTIFEPGARLASAHPQGSGMGLAIVDRLTHHMDGSVRVVDVESGETHASGTAFEIRLPAPQTAPDGASRDAIISDPSSPVSRITIDEQHASDGPKMRTRGGARRSTFEHSND